MRLHAKRHAWLSIRYVPSFSSLAFSAPLSTLRFSLQPPRAIAAATCRFLYSAIIIVREMRGYPCTVQYRYLIRIRYKLCVYYSSELVMLACQGTSRAQRPTDLQIMWWIVASHRMTNKFVTDDKQRAMVWSLSVSVSVSARSSEKESVSYPYP